MIKVKDGEQKHIVVKKYPDQESCVVRSVKEG